MEKEHKFEGLELLEDILGFTRAYSNPIDWTYNKLKEFEDEHYAIELQKIEAQLKAFQHLKKEATAEQLQKAIGEFLNGEFIQVYHLSDLIPITKYAYLYIDMEVTEAFDLYKFDQGSYQRQFLSLLDTKKKFYELGSLYKSSLVSNVFTLYQYQFINPIIKHIEANQEELNKALTMIINPKNLSFSKAELVEDFAYPEEEFRNDDWD